MDCRCEVLNVLSGDAARDHAVHLDITRSPGQGHTYYRCPATGVGWVEESALAAYGGERPLLRRTDRV